MTEKKGTTPLDVLRRTKELREQIAQKKNDLPGQQEFSLSTMAIGSTAVRLESFVRNNGGNEGAISPAKKQEYLQIKSDLEEKRQKGKDLLARDNQLRAELAALEEELSSSPSFGKIEDLLVIVGEISKVKDEINALTAALKEQEALANSTAGADDLAAKRDELLADAAMGKDVKKALDAVQIKLAAAEKQAEKGIDAEQAAAVLKKRLATAWVSLAELIEAQRQALADLLSERATLVKDQYQSLATALGETVKGMMAIDALMDRYAPSHCTARFISGDLRNMKLPSMSSNELLFSPGTVDVQKAADHEMAQLNELAGADLTPNTLH